MQTDCDEFFEQEIPPNDELLFHWTLSVDDLRFIIKLSHSSGFRVWLGLQMCYLRRFGIFARNDNEFPATSLSWMNRQFKVHPLATLESPKRDATWSQQRQGLLTYLGWNDFEPENPDVKEFIKGLVQKGKAKSEIVADVPGFLKSIKIVCPQSKIELERYIRSEIEDVSDFLNENVIQSISGI